MNNNEVKNVENKQNNSLMRKTKAQLIELIFRKDSVERNLREAIKELESKICNLKWISDKYKSLQDDYRSMCDDKFYIECEFNTTIKKQKVFIWILSIILCISIALNYVFCII